MIYYKKRIQDIETKKSQGGPKEHGRDFMEFEDEFMELAKKICEEFLKGLNNGNRSGNNISDRPAGGDDRG